MKIKTFISFLLAFTFTSIVNANGQNSLTSTPLAISNDFAYYSFPLMANAKLDLIHRPAKTDSDEYWFKTTGKALNKGIVINTTQAGALIRITQGKSAKTLTSSSDIDLSLLKLVSKQKPKQSAISKVFSKNQLAKNSVFDNTLVIKTATNINGGALILKTSQALYSDDTYMISVKEKNSPLRLHLALNAQTYGENNQVEASAQLFNANKKLLPKSVKATLIAPNGQRSPVNFSADHQGKLSFNLTYPHQAIAPINGLYEILVEAKTQTHNLVAQRNAKLALAFTNNTAHIAAVKLDPQATQAAIQVMVKKTSRFETRMVLYGTNYNGNLIPIMETHAAQSFKPGKNTMRIPFDQKILSNAQLSAPFELRNIRLFDQKQLGLIDTFKNQLTF